MLFSTSAFKFNVCRYILVSLFTLLRRTFQGDAEYTAAAKASLAALFASSFAIRWLLQDPHHFSIIRAGDGMHYSDYLTSSSHGWIKDYCGYDIRCTGV
jgi:hypothetical protein